MEELEYIPNKDEVKAGLPLQFACAQLGIRFNERGYARCPVHDDERPSLYLFTHDDGETHFACQPCGVAGDVFTLLRWFYGCSFPEALAHARDLLRELPEGYSAPEPVRVEREPIDVTTYAPEVAEAQQRALQPGHLGYIAARVGFASLKDQDVCEKWDRWLVKNLGWGVNAVGEIWVPHWDPDGKLLGVKRRHVDGSKTAIDGSNFTEHLYGVWRGKRAADVLLTEGESDCVYASLQAAREKLPLDVYALPSGAGHFEPAWLEAIRRYKTVYLAFDPDRAGVDATRRWLEALASHRDVRVCFLPLGRDLRDARPELTRLLSRANAERVKPQGFKCEHDGFFSVKYVTDKATDEEIELLTRVTDWTIEPVARLVQTEGAGSGYVVDLKVGHHRQQTIIHHQDLLSTRDVAKWCDRHGLFFTGTDGHLKRLADWLSWRGSVVPEVHQTDQVGMQRPVEGYEFAGPSAVFPSGYIGQTPWRYVRSATTADVSRSVLLPTDGAFEWKLLEKFLQLSSSDVTHPLLAWVCAAARRREAKQFPLLFIGGSSGVGKSTLARLVTRLLGSQIELDLGAVTPFILMRTLAASTSLPVFVDEWTRMSRKDTREAFQGAIPVLYTGGVAERGQADLSAARYNLTAPTLVAGEDTFMLDREIERTVSVSPSRATQSVEALEALIDKPLERFGQVLFTFLCSQPELPPFSATLENRREYNRHVLEVGWQTLHALLDEASRFEEVPDVPTEPDLTGLDKFADDEEENVYEQALMIGMSMRDRDGHPLVWRDGGGRGTWARFQNLVGVIQSQNIDLQLPGGSRAMKRYFDERFGRVELGKAITPPGAFTPVRAWLIPNHELPESDDARASYMPT